MATLTTQNISRTGVGPTYAACTGGGDRFTPDKDTFLHVKNGSGGALTVTVAATKVPLPGMTITNVVVSVPAGGERMIGPFPYDMFAAVDGSALADVTYSGVTSLTIGVIKTVEP